MKKSLLASTLIAATVLAVPAWAESSSDLGFEYNNSQFYTTPSADSDEDYDLKTYGVSLSSAEYSSGNTLTFALDSGSPGGFSGMVGSSLTIYCDHNGNENYYTVSGTTTFNYGSSVVVDASNFAFIEGEESVEIALIISGSITFYVDETTSYSISSDDTEHLDEFIDEYVTVIGGYTLSDWKYEDGVLSATITAASTPEPSMFGALFGLGALGLVVTRRRRRA